MTILPAIALGEATLDPETLSLKIVSQGDQGIFGELTNNGFRITVLLRLFTPDKHPVFVQAYDDQGALLQVVRSFVDGGFAFAVDLNQAPVRFSWIVYRISASTQARELNLLEGAGPPQLKASPEMAPPNPVSKIVVVPYKRREKPVEIRPLTPEEVQQKIDEARAKQALKKGS